MFHLVTIEDKIENQKKKKRKKIKFSSLLPSLDNSTNGKSKLTRVKRFLNKI